MDSLTTSAYPILSAFIKVNRILNYHPSYVELEYAIDDVTLIDEIVAGILSPGASTHNISHTQLHDKTKKVDVLD